MRGCEGEAEGTVSSPRGSCRSRVVAAVTPAVKESREKLADLDRRVDSQLVASAAASAKARELMELATRRLSLSGQKQHDVHLCAAEAQQRLSSRAVAWDDEDEEDGGASDEEASSLRADEAAASARLAIDLRDLAARDDERSAAEAVATALMAEVQRAEAARAAVAAEAEAVRAQQKEKVRAWKHEIKKTVNELEAQHASDRAALVEAHDRAMKTLRNDITPLRAPVVVEDEALRVSPPSGKEGGEAAPTPLAELFTEEVRRSIQALEANLDDRLARSADLVEKLLARDAAAAASRTGTKAAVSNNYSLLVAVGALSLTYLIWPAAFCYVEPAQMLAH